jgi:hypothetical protein
VAPRRTVVAATCRRRIRASRTTKCLSEVSYVHTCTPGGSSLQALGSQPFTVRIGRAGKRPGNVDLYPPQRPCRRR